MSRVGKKPINIPNGVQISIAAKEHDVITVKGPKGTLTVNLPKEVKSSQQDNQITFTVKNPESKDEKALWGMSRNLVNNAVIGVTEAYGKSLEINGVGFKAAVQGKKLVLNVGFSHPVEYNIPEGINIAVEKNQISISGIDKQQVGQIAAEIRNIKKPEPYKGKGIKYTAETIRRKAGKVVKS